MSGAILTPAKSCHPPTPCRGSLAGCRSPRQEPRPVGAGRSPDLPAADRPEEAVLGHLQGGPGRPAVFLPLGHPWAGDRRGHPLSPARAASARGAFLRRGPPLLRGHSLLQAPDDPHDGLRRRVADLRGGQPPGERHRQPADGDPRPSGEAEEGSVHDPLAGALADAAALVGSGPAGESPFSRPVAGLSHERGDRAEDVQGCPTKGGDRQAGDAPHPEAQFRHALAGGRDGSSRDPGIAGPCQPRTTALYTHVSTKLIAQTTSPLDLLQQDSNEPKASPPASPSDPKPQPSATPKAEIRRSAKPRPPKKRKTDAPKKAAKPRRRPTKKGRKPR